MKEVYKKTIVCDKCNHEMTYTGIKYLSHPAKLEYKCSKCNNVRLVRELI